VYGLAGVREGRSGSADALALGRVVGGRAAVDAAAVVEGLRRDVAAAGRAVRDAEHRQGEDPGEVVGGPGGGRRATRIDRRQLVDEPPPQDARRVGDAIGQAGAHGAHEPGLVDAARKPPRGEWCQGRDFVLGQGQPRCGAAEFDQGLDGLRGVLGEQARLGDVGQGAGDRPASWRGGVLPTARWTAGAAGGSWRPSRALARGGARARHGPGVGGKGFRYGFRGRPLGWVTDPPPGLRFTGGRTAGLRYDLVLSPISGVELHEGIGAFGIVHHDRLCIEPAIPGPRVTTPQIPVLLQLGQVAPCPPATLVLLAPRDDARVVGHPPFGVHQPETEPPGATRQPRVVEKPPPVQPTPHAQHAPRSGGTTLEMPWRRKIFGTLNNTHCGRPLFSRRWSGPRSVDSARGSTNS